MPSQSHNTGSRCGRQCGAFGGVPLDSYNSMISEKVCNEGSELSYCSLFDLLVGWRCGYRRKGRGGDHSVVARPDFTNGLSRLSYIVFLALSPR